MLLLTLFSCAAKGPPADPGPPKLPGIEAPVYASVVWSPRDPLVAYAAASREATLDEALSGAAAAVALAVTKGQFVDASTARWAAYRAGWPHPLESFGAQSVDEGDTAAGLGGLIAGAAAEGAALGLARARGPDGDAWATLVSRPKIALAPFLRERALGELFEPPITDPGAFTDLATRAISPSLGVRFTPFALDEPGEWVVEIEGRPAAGGPRALLAAFPLYVGEPTPEDGPLLVATPVRLDDPEAEALALLDDLRGLEDAPALTADPTLAASARAGVRLRTRDDETADPDPAARMRALGFTGRGAELACQAPTLSACLDSLWWSIDDRRHLLDPGLTLAGVAVETGPPLTLVVNLSVP